MKDFFNFSENFKYGDHGFSSDVIPEFSVLMKEPFIKVINFFDKAEIFIEKFEGIEAISEQFEFKVLLFSKNCNLDLDKAITSSICLEINGNSKSGSSRFINGVITEFSQIGIFEKGKTNFARYYAVIRPQMWLMRFTKNYAIFQDKTAIEIIKSVITDSKIKNVKYNVTRCGKRKREFCVQYGQSNLDFVSKLMEEEGIFYFFSHQNSGHTLHICDSSDAHKNIPRDANVEMLTMGNDDFDVGYVLNSSITQGIKINSCVTQDYNFELSKTNLLKSVNIPKSNFNAEIYQFPGNYSSLEEGKRLLDLQADFYNFSHKIINGYSTIPEFVAGANFTLKGHANEAFNTSYTLYSVKHSFAFNEKCNKLIYENKFCGFLKNTTFRPSQKTIKPKISGSQTAVVTGGKPGEVFRDKYGRIKIFFYWDRNGKKDASSSCWIRVSQMLAGPLSGSLFTPRVGTEVIVNFLHGDPDKPIIIGCLYNDKNMPPYDKDQDSVNCIKTLTIPDEDGFNELRFDDKKEKEEVYLHAQRDYNQEIINARNALIKNGNDSVILEKGSVDVNLQAKGDNNANYKIAIKKGDLKIIVDEGNIEYILKKGNQSLIIKDGDQSITISKGNRDLQIKKNESHQIGGDYSIKVKGNLDIDVSGNVNIKAGKKFSISAKSDASISAKSKLNLKSTTDMSMDAGTNLSMKAKINAEMSSQVGVKISGTNVETSGKAMTKINAPMITIGGGIVKLG